MAEVAVELERAIADRRLSGAPGNARGRRLASGEGWTVSDVICTSGPRDRPFEERHSSVSIAIVLHGTFQYRSRESCELMTPGSLLLGNNGQCFECGHEHGTGDRCLAVHYSPEFVEELASECRLSMRQATFGISRIPAIRDVSPLAAIALAMMGGAVEQSWEEFSVKLAAKAVQLANAIPARSISAPAGAMARVTNAIRSIDAHPSGAHDLTSLANAARLSPYHFLRTFEGLTGSTPHQYVRRARLRLAAVRLLNDSSKILDVALDTGFGDVSNFNRAFRQEFSISPRAFRRDASDLTSGGREDR